MTNFEKQQAWLLAQVSKKTIEVDLKNISYFLISNERLISSAIGINPLEFSVLLANKLEKVKLFATSEEDLQTILECESKLKTYQAFLITHMVDAIRIAEDLEKMHEDSIEQSKLVEIYSPTTSTASRNPLEETIFDKGLSSYIEIFKNLLPKINGEESSSISIYPSRYNGNYLAQLFLNDSDFISKAMDTPIGGEMGHLIVQRFFSIKQKTREWYRVNRYFQQMIFAERGKDMFFHYEPEAFKTEVIKLYLYKMLSLTNDPNSPPVAWLGSAGTLTQLLQQAKTKEEEIVGIYLNCDDKLYSYELNRAWLLALIHMGYETKLVEKQFPNVRESLLSNEPGNFLMALLTEVRQLELSAPNDSEEAISTNSQYNGGDSPTATSLEILLMLSMGCKVTRNIVERNISLYKPIATLEYHASSSRVDLTPIKARTSHSTPCTPAPNSVTCNSVCTNGASSTEVRASSLPYSPAIPSPDGVARTLLSSLPPSSSSNTSSSQEHDSGATHSLRSALIFQGTTNPDESTTPQQQILENANVSLGSRTNRALFS